MESKWCHLPSDILATVAKLIDSDLMSIPRLKAVCSSWRSSFPSTSKPSLFPLQLSSPFKPSIDTRRFSLSQRTLFLISPLVCTSPWAWIIQVEESDPSKWSFFDPLMPRSKTRVSESPELPLHLQLLNYRVLRINQSYDLDFSEEEFDGFTPPDFFDQGFCSFVRKVIVQSDHGIIDNNDYFIVVALCGNGDLAYWKYGANEWIPLENMNYNFPDVICYGGEFYGVENGGRLVRIDLSNSTLVEIVTKPLEELVDYLYLVHFDGCLFLVNCRFTLSGMLPMVNVYVLNEENETWNCTNDFHGGVCFVCHGNAFAVSSKDLGVNKGNVVYYEGVACYNDEDDCPGICSFACELDQSSRVSSWWPQRPPFWPPPSWITATDKSPSPLPSSCTNLDSSS